MAIFVNAWPELDEARHAMILSTVVEKLRLKLACFGGTVIASDEITDLLSKSRQSILIWVERFILPKSVFLSKEC